MSWPPPSDPSSGPPPYGYPPPGYPVQPQWYGRPPARNGLAITSLVLGILALATSWLSLPGVILGILAVIFGCVGIARARSDRVSNKGMAIAGLITGVLGLAVGVLLLVLGLRIAAGCQDEYGADITQQELESCIQDNIGA